MCVLPSNGFGQLWKRERKGEAHRGVDSEASAGPLDSWRIAWARLVNRTEDVVRDGNRKIKPHAE